MLILFRAESICKKYFLSGLVESMGVEPIGANSYCISGISEARAELVAQRLDLGVASRTWHFYCDDGQHRAAGIVTAALCSGSGGSRGAGGP